MRKTKNHYGPLFPKLFHLEETIQASIDFLKNAASEHPFDIVLGAFSGGKDSCTLKEIAKLAGIEVRWFYSYTGIDPPEVVKFIKEHHSDVLIIPPKKSFWELLKKNGPARVHKRWCCRYLKEGNEIRYLQKLNLIDQTQSITLLLGTRKEESSKRSKYKPITTVHSKKVMINRLLPIFYWSEYHIWEFIDSNSIPYCSLYDSGFHRIGCIVCPFHSKKELDISKIQYPSLFNNFEKCSKVYFDYHKEKGKDFNGKTFQEYISDWYNKT